MHSILQVNIASKRGSAYHCYANVGLCIVLGSSPSSDSCCHTTSFRD